MDWIKTLDQLPEQNRLLLFVNDLNSINIGKFTINKFRPKEGLVFQTEPFNHKGQSIVNFHYPEMVIKWAYIGDLPSIEPHSEEERKVLWHKGKGIEIEAKG